MKKLFLSLIIGLTASVANINAAVVSGSMLATNADSVVSTPLVITKLTLWSTNTTTPSIVYLYDGWTLQTNTAYTNYTSARTAVASTYVTTTGVTNSFTNYVFKTTANPVAAATVVNNPTATFVVPTSGELLTIDNEEAGLIFGRQLSISNSADGLNYVIQYRSP